MNPSRRVPRTVMEQAVADFRKRLRLTRKLCVIRFPHNKTMAIREEKVIYFVRHRIQKNKSTGLFDCEITKHSKRWWRNQQAHACRSLEVLSVCSQSFSLDTKSGVLFEARLNGGNLNEFRPPPNMHLYIALAGEGFYHPLPAFYLKTFREIQS